MGSVATEDRSLGGPHGPLPVRIYRPAAPAGPGVVWLHGGGFSAGDLDMPEADWVSRRFAERGIVVASVDYRLAPMSPVQAELAGIERPAGGFPYPVASEEVAFAFAWAAASDLADGPWALGGASAGGNLATGATLRLARGDGPVPALVVLAYPTLHDVQDPPDAALRRALDADPAADVFGPEAVRGMYENYLGGPASHAEPDAHAEPDTEVFAVPGRATAADLAGFPPTIIVNGDVDELRMSGEAFARALTAAGVTVDVSTEPGTRHGHLNDPGTPAAIATVERFTERTLALRNA